MSDFADYLRRRTKLISAALETSLDEEAYPQIPASLRESLRYALLNGGKRIRPILCLAACEAVGGSIQTALPAALAIETLHTYTLVHDDLPCMDDDDQRRGYPTLHVKFGHAQAVLAGDALQALAFEFLTRLDIPGKALQQAGRTFAKAAGPAGVVGGQWVDVTANPPHNAARLAYVHLHKTADLIACAAALGAIAGEGTDEQIATLTEYGKHLGLAFQIVDDLLDEPERKSKENPEMSCLDIWTTEEARAEAAFHTQAAISAIATLPGSIWALRDLVTYLLDRRA